MRCSEITGSRIGPSAWRFGVALLAVFGAGVSLAAQDAPRTEPAIERADAARLPEAPAAGEPVAVEGLGKGQRFTPTLAGRYDKYIQPGQQAPGLTVHDKVVLGFRDAFSPTSIAVWPIVAGYEQVTHSAPDWPLNKAGYFRRAGAAAVRDSSDGIFSDSIFSPLFHQDPRYYKVGPQRGLFYRTFYALTRPLVTLTDRGHRTVNVSEITGTVFGSWLTDVYYPTNDQHFGQTAKTFGGSMGSSALGCFLAEFADDVLVALHLEKPR